MSIVADGLGAAIRGLETWRDVDRTTLFRRLGAKQEELTSERLEKRRSHTGGTYPASKRALREGGTTLEDTGAMIGNFRGRNANRNSVTMGFDSLIEGKKAVYAQNGTRAFTARRPFPIMKNGGSKEIIAWGRKKAATPPRPVFGIAPSDLTVLQETINDFEQEMIRKAGLKHG